MYDENFDCFDDVQCDEVEREEWDEDFYGEDDEHDQFLTDAEADADALASAGMGMDEDYGQYDYDSYGDGDY